MPDDFLHLPASEQSEILTAIAPKLGMAPVILEKDVWVCWTLEHLFTMPGRLPMAFKGGTALSKVYGVIERFSEDIDITLDYREFAGEVQEGQSRSSITRLSNQLKEFVLKHADQVVEPHFQKLLKEQFPAQATRVTLSENGEEVRIHYPSVFEEQAGRYMAANVLIEFGGRNITEPNEQHLVRPYAAQEVSDLNFPEADATVLAIARSYWEKATLIHVECSRQERRPSAERLSRHWYDMARLYRHERSKHSLTERELLADVIKHKKLFYNASYANYDACLSGHFRLVPEQSLLEALRKDFGQMVEAGMFYSSPSFDEIIEELRELELAINQMLPS